MLPVPIGLTSTYCEASPKSIGAAEALDDDEDDTEVALDEGWGSLLELGWGWLSSGLFWCLIGSLWLAGSCFFISSTLSTLNHLEADHETLTNHCQNYFILKYFHRSGDDFWCFRNYFTQVKTIFSNVCPGWVSVCNWVRGKREQMMNGDVWLRSPVLVTVAARTCWV